MQPGLPCLSGEGTPAVGSYQQRGGQHAKILAEAGEVIPRANKTGDHAHSQCGCRPGHSPPCHLGPHCMHSYVRLWLSSSHCVKHFVHMPPALLTHFIHASVQKEMSFRSLQEHCLSSSVSLRRLICMVNITLTPTQKHRSLLKIQCRRMKTLPLCSLMHLRACRGRKE